MSTVLQPMIYMPEQGLITVTSPKKFHGARNVHSITDCSELFTETPQDHDLQITWSTYKRHNTLTFLIIVAPNSSILYISPAYLRRI